MLQRQIETKRAISVSICQKLRAEIDNLGFSKDEELTYPYFDTANFSLEKDPYTGDFNLIGYWYSKRDKRRIEKIGRIQFNSDDSFYAEFDVVKPHPTKSNYFVESVTAWGRDDVIKTDIQLLPMSAED